MKRTQQGQAHHENHKKNSEKASDGNPKAEGKETTNE